MFETIQTIYFLWGYDPGNMSVSTYPLYSLLSWAQFTVVLFHFSFLHLISGLGPKLILLYSLPLNICGISSNAEQCLEDWARGCVTLPFSPCARSSISCVYCTLKPNGGCSAPSGEDIETYRNRQEMCRNCKLLNVVSCIVCLCLRSCDSLHNILVEWHVPPTQCWWHCWQQFVGHGCHVLAIG